MTTHTIDLPWDRPPLTQNRSSRATNPHLKARLVRESKAVAEFAIKNAQIPFLPGANVTLHFRPATRHRRDADGTCATLKVCLDALVTAGVLHDDSWVEVPYSGHRIHPPTTEGPAMWLEIEEIQ